MGKAQGKASENAEGLAGEKETQPSDAQGTTSPKTGEPVKFDPNGKYVNPHNPEETISGKEVESLVNQGFMLRDTQAARDKAVVQIQQKNAEIATLTQKAEEAERQTQEFQTKQIVLDALKGVDITKKTGEKQQEADPWFINDSESESALKPEDVLRRIDEVANKRLAGLKDSARDVVKEILAEEKAGEESQRRVSEFVQRTRQVKADMLATELPDVPVSDRDTILNLQAKASELDSVARDLVAAGDMDRAEEAWAEAEGRRAELIRRSTDARLEQGKLTAQREREEEIESITRGGPEVTGQKPRRRKFRWGKEAEAEAEANFQKAREMVARTEQLKNY